MSQEKEKAPGAGLRNKRITVRLPTELDLKIRQEASQRGTNLNQMMMYILYKKIDLV